MTWYAFLRLPAINGTWTVKHVQLNLESFAINGDTGYMAMNIPKMSADEAMGIMYMTASYRLEARAVLYQGTAHLYNPETLINQTDVLIQASLIAHHLKQIAVSDNMDADMYAYLYFRDTNAPFTVSGSTLRSYVLENPTTNTTRRVFGGGITTWSLNFDVQSNPMRCTFTFALEGGVGIQ